MFKRAGQIGRPCLLGYIGKCSAPCVGRVSADEHRQIVDDFCDFMAGKTDTMIKRLERRMSEASANLEFELAARLRDDLEALRRAMEKQAVVFGDGTDADVVAFAEDELEAAVQVFHVRGGRIRGQRGWVVDKLDPDTATGELVEQFVTQFYGQEGETEIPREVLVPELPEDTAALTEWLTERRGSRVRLRVPQRGDKRALAETVRRNAAQSLNQHKLKRASDLTARSRALGELQEQLACRPRRCASSASTSATCRAPTSSRPWWCSRTAWPARASTAASPCARAPATPTGSPRSIRRRFARYLDEHLESARTPTDPGARRRPSRPGIDPTTGQPKKFAYAPNLVVVDGGAPAGGGGAGACWTISGIDDVALVGLAKRLEEVWLPGEAYPAILPRTSEGLYLLQRVRDEAHRFAITYHREKRSRR